MIPGQNIVQTWDLREMANLQNAKNGLILHIPTNKAFMQKYILKGVR